MTGWPGLAEPHPGEHAAVTDVSARDDLATPTAGQKSELDLTSEEAGRGWRAYLRAMGPGLITGASDDDPSGIGTYSQAGSQFGYSMLWTALLTFPLMAAVQEICDRTALATGAGLGELAARSFTWVWKGVLGALLVALLVANTLNISADVVAVGSGMHLLHAGPTALWAMIAGALVTVVLISGSFPLIARVFKILCAALLSYIAVLFMAHPHWGAIAHNSFVPHFRWTKDYIALFIAVLGTTISPYLFFWQSAHRLEEMRDEPAGGSRALPLRRRPRGEAMQKVRTSRVDVFTGMLFSNAVMFAVIAGTAATLGAHGSHNIASAADAARALRPFAGRFASAVFALGFIGSGMLAIPVLAGSGSVGIAGLLGKKWGFSQSVRKAPVFYGLVLVGTVGGTLLSALHIDPIRLLVYVAIVNGIAAAPFLVLVMVVANNKTLMGEYRNGRLANGLGWLAAALMAASAVAFFLTGGASGL
jgi:NRAMP (natural resistance-associated macrophage protein)-like metal ion transporter